MTTHLELTISYTGNLMSIRLPNSCFIHIPRTGGLWVKALIERSGIKHQTLKGDIDSHLPYKSLPENWQHLHSFSTIRHPLAWVRSRWTHALEINAYEGHRHYGIHRDFDICVRQTLEETIQVIVNQYPGLVYRTFQEMTDGVKTILQYEQLPDNIYAILNKYEGLSIDTLKRISPDRFNSTSQLYKNRNSISDKLLSEFLSSESETIKWWESCG